MGREIRKVPVNWDHPKKLEHFQPMFDRSCEMAFTEWLDEYKKWIEGEYAEVIEKYGDEADIPKDQPFRAFCQWQGTPPDPEYYRPQWPKGEATWWQVYETVSEGTPVTPPFKTQQELIEYLVENGDYWDQRRRKDRCTTMNCEPWSREQAETFVMGSGWAPSLIVDSSGVHAGHK